MSKLPDQAVFTGSSATSRSVSRGCHVGRRFPPCRPLRVRKSGSRSRSPCFGLGRSDTPRDINHERGQSGIPRKVSMCPHKRADATAEGGRQAPREASYTSQISEKRGTNLL